MEAGLFTRAHLPERELRDQRNAWRERRGLHGIGPESRQPSGLRVQTLQERREDPLLDERANDLILLSNVLREELRIVPKA